jgi:hypothetical protein
MNRSLCSLAAPLLLAVGCAKGQAEQSPPEAPPTPPEVGSAAIERPVEPPPAAPSPSVNVEAAVTKVVSAPKDGPRIYAKTRHVWIRPEPDAQKQWIGFLWTGGSVKLKSETPIAGPGCANFYAIEPQGYVCADGERATIDPEDPVLKAILPYAPKTDTPTPHRYGESIGAPRRYHLEGADIVFPTLPRTISEPRKQVKPRSTVAYSAETTANGQSYLLTADFAWVPKDKVVPYPEITFKGIHLDARVKLPLALFRGKDRPQYRRSPDGAFTPSGEEFKRLSFVALSGQRAEYEGETYLEVAGGEAWVKESEAVVPTPRPTTPWGAPVGEEDTTGKAPKGRATWIEASIRGGWLIAFEGTKPVFVTLISAGRGGEPQPGKDLIETASTPVGTYPITGKFATATMEAPNEYIHADVPWAQNFHGPHALHGAYWHDDWGNLKSGGCINVSPIDGKELFEWTDPPVPEGWHGVRWLPWQGPATLLVVHK